MYTKEIFWLTASVLSTVLAASLTVSAQTPEETSSPTLTAEAGTPRPSLAPTLVPPQPAPEALGDSLMIHRRYQAAIEAYKQAQAPEASAVVWNKMGIAYQMMFNLQDATRCYEQSLKLDSRNANVLNNLGTVY